MAARETSELRAEVPRDELAVLDGYCSGHGLDRTTVLRQILREWATKQLHVATVICRVAGRNPTSSETDR